MADRPTPQSAGPAPTVREPALPPPVPSRAVLLGLTAVVVTSIAVVGVLDWSPVIAVAAVALAIWGYFASTAVAMVKARKGRGEDSPR